MKAKPLLTTPKYYTNCYMKWWKQKSKNQVNSLMFLLHKKTTEETKPHHYFLAKQISSHNMNQLQSLSCLTRYRTASNYWLQNKLKCFLKTGQNCSLLEICPIQSCPSFQMIYAALPFRISDRSPSVKSNFQLTLFHFKKRLQALYNCLRMTENEW